MDCEKCYRFLRCYACLDFMSCKENKILTERQYCFKCDDATCENNVVEDCESCKLPEVE